ncbi:hypothetical protein [Streptomyces sp. NPDC059708]
MRRATAVGRSGTQDTSRAVRRARSWCAGRRETSRDWAKALR